MVTRIILTAATTALSCIFLVPVDAGEGWYHSYQEARAVADRENLPLLIHFHASYCGPCRQMTSQVFSQPDVRRQLRQGIAAVEIDVAHHPDLAERYGARTVPRDVVIYPGQSGSVTLNVGFKSAFAYKDLLRSVAAQGAQYAKTNSKKPEIRVVETQPTPSNDSVTGLEGYCPVTLIRNRKWVTGQEGLTESYRGITYNFSDEDARSEFRRNPAKFTPQNLGCDPVVLYSDQQAIAGEIQYGAFFDNQLYLFESQENRRVFKENPLKYGRIRHALKVDDLKNRRIQ